MFQSGRQVNLAAHVISKDHKHLICFFSSGTSCTTYSTIAVESLVRGGRIQMRKRRKICKKNFADAICTPFFSSTRWRTKKKKLISNLQCGEKVELKQVWRKKWERGKKKKEVAIIHIFFHAHLYCTSAAGHEETASQGPWCYCRHNSPLLLL